MALTPFPSSVGLGKIRIQDLLIVNLLRYPLDQAFAHILVVGIDKEDRIYIYEISKKKMI